MAFSLSLLDTVAQSNQGAKMSVINPLTGLPAYLDDDKDEPVKAVTITFLGLSSKQFEINTLKELRVAAKQTHGKKKGEIDIPDDIIDKEAEKSAKRLAGLVVDWENLPDENGKPIPFSKEKAEELFLKFKDLRVQADAFVADKVNFIQGSEQKKAKA